MPKIMSPVEAGEKFIQWFDSKRRFVFFSAIIIGLLTHFLAIVYGLMSQDGLMNSVLFSASDFETAVGRWGIDWIDSIRQNQAVSAVSSIFSIFWAAMATVFLTEIFGFQKKSVLILSAAAVMTFPALTSDLLYQYCSDAYMIGFFLAVLSVWCYRNIKDMKWAVLCFWICEVFSLSLYQAYLGVIIGAEVILVLFDLLQKKEDLKKTVCNALIFIASSITGLGLYYVMTRIMCKVRAVEMATYGGFSTFSIGEFIKNIGFSLRSAYHQFFFYFFNDDIIYNTSWNRHVLFGVLFVAILVLLVWTIVKKKIWKEPVRLFFVLFCIGILPMALDIIFFITTMGRLYALNSMPLVLVFFLLLGLLDEQNVEGVALVKWVGVLTMITVLFTYYMADVYSYAYLKTSYDQAYSVSSRMLERMEETEDYERGMPVAITGIVTDEQFPRAISYQLYVIDDIVASSIFHPLLAGGRNSWFKFFLTYHGEIINIADDVSYLQAVESEEFEEMGIFPAQDSVKVINGVMVIKMSEEAPIGED